MSALQHRIAAAIQAFLHPASPDIPVRPSAAPAPAPPPPEARIEAPSGARNVVLVVLDSCRFDTFAAHVPSALRRFGTPERRQSYASWTAPSHHNLMMGLLPHRNTPSVHAADVYREEFAEWGRRLGAGISFERLLPSLWLPTLLRHGLGYRTVARVSLPVLNPGTALNRDFDDFRLMPKHNDFGAILDELRFYVDQPTFALLNVGETHYPYALADDPRDLPVLHGLHGVVRRLDAQLSAGVGVHAADGEAFFEASALDALKERQASVVRRLDPLFEQLFDTVPAGTWICVTADHGELFGEAGFFGHGPIAHEKMWEVPFLEGLR